MDWGQVEWEQEIHVGLGKEDEVEGRNTEETARVEGHMREDTRNYCSGNIIKYIKVILMNSPNNEEVRVPTHHLLSLNKSLSRKLGSI